jgi:hypothetical protein
MENKKLWMGILIILVFGFIMTACGGGQKLTGPTDAFYFRLTNGNEGYSIAKGKTSESKINIPASYRPDTNSDFLPVTQIEMAAFSGLTDLASVTIPEGVMYIFHYAFSGCTGLTNIKLPSTITHIRENAFADCASLASITIPKGVTRIDRNTFENCTSLATITIPASVTEISSNAFAGCTSLANITLPKDLKTIGRNTFENCTGIASITIPAGVTSIGTEAFAGWTSSQTINIQGKANREATDWVNEWDNGCNAVINYGK